MKNKFLGFVSLLYVLLIIYSWISGNLSNFIAPNMQIYLKIAVIPLTIMGLLLVFNNKNNYKFKLSDLVLLIPVLMIISSGDGKLSMSLANNRRAISKKVNIIDNNSLEVDTNNNDNTLGRDKDEEVIDGIFFDVDDSVYSYLADYITYMAGAKKFVGKTIRLRGFTTDFGNYLPNGYFAIGKYYITCCAADSEFAGFIAKSDYKIEFNKWYEITGVLESGKDSEGYDIIAVNVKSIKEIDGDSEKQYVYSCNNYGDGKCSKLQQYDLEY
ncbi:MAG: DUF1980 domain-containing protein [Bacilli bacterium]|nr:DUF1980 domain-containing protein [Bacilli bacterium]